MDAPQWAREGADQAFEVDPREGLPEWIKHLADVAIRPDDNPDERLRKRVVTLTTLTVAAVVSIWPIAYGIVGLYEAAVVPAIYVVLTAIGFVAMSVTKNDALYRNVQLVLLLAFPALLQWLLGGFVAGSAVVLFGAVAPILTLMVVGRRWSAILLGAFIVIVSVLGYADSAIVRAVAPVPREVGILLFVLNIIGVILVLYFPLSFYIRAFDRTHAALQDERLRSDRLIADMLPPSVVARLKAGERLIADELTDVVVLFADVVGFTSVIERLPAERIVRGLNEIFREFDRLTAESRLQKIKTIGDAYMVAGGISTTDTQTVAAMADLALTMRSASRQLSIDGETLVRFRFGMDVGPVIGGVMGDNMLSYDLYGDVVNTASRMASHGDPDRIQVTDRVRARLDGAFRLESRGLVSLKGKGEAETFFLERSSTPHERRD
jgi:guanylate cyclase